MSFNRKYLLKLIFLFGPKQLQLYQVKGLRGGRGVSGPKGGIILEDALLNHGCGYAFKAGNIGACHEIIA